MQDITLFTFARALHVAGVVLWIGGVAFVTTVLLPALKKRRDAEDKFELFEQLEGRFSLQAKVTTLLTGLTGFYMLDFMQAWDRYLQPQFWWLHLMTAVWVIFTLVLFFLEPLFLHRWFRERALMNSEKAFAVLHRMHKILLAVSVLAVLGAVGGSHGFVF